MHLGDMCITLFIINRLKALTQCKPTPEATMHTGYPWTSLLYITGPVMTEFTITVNSTTWKKVKTKLLVPRGSSTGGQRADPQWKMWPQCPPTPPPHFGPASLDFHLNRPVISLIQLHIVPPAPQLEIWPPIGLVPEPRLLDPDPTI